MTFPLVTIIIPCYNQAIFLNDSVGCIINQTYSNWECIIINDGSRDDTGEVAKQFAKHDNRIKYIEKENGGLASARNAGLKNATGEYIQFLDADDIIENEKLALSVEAFNKNPENNFVISDFVMHHMYESKFILPKVNLSNMNLTFDYLLLNWDPYGFNFPIHSPVYKASVLKEFYFNENFRAVEDLILHLQIFKYYNNYSSINKPLAVYRKHGSNMTGDKTHMVKNFMEAYEFIMETLVDDANKNAFFKRVNRVWGGQALMFLDEIDQCKEKQEVLFNSTTYKVGRLFLSPLTRIKDYFKLSFV
ncbi:MAG: glycosyltransferase family 2 protein [Flavobacterium sp.]|nr:MAG: glycosyltransferase family 2 protein [Flavobacterium sp.]